jgi:uncharacterized protein
VGDPITGPNPDSGGWPPPGHSAPDWPPSTLVPPGHGTAEDRLWAVLAHLSIFLLGIAFPLTVVLVKGHKSPYVCHHAVEALNFQVTVLLALFGCSMLAAVLVGLLLVPVVLVVAAGLAVVAAIRADRGAWYRYPVTLRLVS